MLRPSFAASTKNVSGLGRELSLLLMVTIWGANFSVVKYALRDFPEIQFNALRLVLASAVFMVPLAWMRWRRSPVAAPVPALTAADWKWLTVLGLIGTVIYQRMFLAGVARTSVANSSLILGCTPVIVALLSSLAGHERLAPARWAGAALSFAGIYAIAGHRASLSSTTLAGDLLMLGSTVCWSLYTVLAQPLLRRHSPLVVTGWSMALGTVVYLAIAAGPLMATDWAAISTLSWILMVSSSLLALAFAYMIWYSAVQRIGSARTAVYSNVTPIIAMLVAAVWLGERPTGLQLAGAALVLTGLAVTRLTPVAK